MSESDQFELWFNNQSGAGGRACVYQPTGNVTFSGTGLQQLAWLMAGANPSVWVRFVWTVRYGFIWIDSGPVGSFQKIPADPVTANKVTLSHNAQGFYFGTPQASTPSGSLIVVEDATVPTVNSAIAGITMGGAPSFSTPAAPNRTAVFTPTSTTALSYCITFGNYTFQVGDVITPSMLSPAATIEFSGTSVMTATLDATNSWKVTPGGPPLKAAAAAYVTCFADAQPIGPK